MPIEATRVHGNRISDVRSKKLDDNRVPSMLERAYFLVEHNAEFDKVSCRQALSRGPAQAVGMLHALYSVGAYGLLGEKPWIPPSLGTQRTR